MTLWGPFAFPGEGGTPDGEAWQKARQKARQEVALPLDPGNECLGEGTPKALPEQKGGDLKGEGPLASPITQGTQKEGLEWQST